MFSKVPAVAKPEEAIVQPTAAAKITPPKVEDSLKGTWKTVSFPIFELFDMCCHNRSVFYVFTLCVLYLSLC